MNTYIIGQTQNEVLFRPSDWTARIASAGATFDGKRLQYSAYMKPTAIDGIPAIVLSEELDLVLIEYALNFAKLNNLQIIVDE